MSRFGKIHADTLSVFHIHNIINTYLYIKVLIFFLVKYKYTFLYYDFGLKYEQILIHVDTLSLLCII